MKPVNMDDNSTPELNYAATQMEFTSLDQLEATFCLPTSETDENSRQASSDEGFLPSSYEMLLMVGEGAMGQVFLARDQDLLRKVAYKRLHEKVSLNPEVLGRFLREVQITAQLEHPNVVPVYNLEKTPQGWAYAMKLVFGKTLKELILQAREAYDQNREVPEEVQLTTLLEHFLKVCEALDFSHHCGVLHRDLKPANIMVGRYREVYVMDWGIARVMGSAGDTADENACRVEVSTVETEGGEVFEETRMGQILGTPRYLSPEQAAGRNAQLDGRSDLLSLGLILFELAALKPAYHAQNLTELLKKTLKAEKAPLTPYHPSRPIRRELAAIIHKATAKRRENRYQTVAEMAADLRRFLRGQSVLAQPDTPLQSLIRWMGQHQVATASTILTLLLLLAGLSLGTLWNQRSMFLNLRHRETRLNTLQTQVSRQARKINNTLLGYTALLRRLEALSAGALKLKPENPKLYRNRDFSLAGQEPSDYAYYPTYAKMLSPTWPVWLLPPGQSAPPPQDLGLSQIKPELQTIFRESYQPEGAPPLPELLQTYNKLPLLWAHIALEDGTYLVYPGQTGFPTGYDPRQQEWYRLGLRKSEPVWTPPHVDILGQGLMLSVVMPIAPESGQPKGVVALDLSFQYLIDQLLKLPLAGSTQNYLVDPEGRVILRSSDRYRLYGLRFGVDLDKQALDTPLFDQAEVVEAMRKGLSGYRRFSRNGRPTLLAFYRLNSLGWYYAVEVDEAKFMEAK